jgi:hypothetical protein
VRVVTVKLAEVAPAGTRIDPWTVAFLVSLLLSDTERPPAGAGPLRVTVPIDGAGAVTVVGFRLRETKAPATCVVAEAEVEFADWLPASSKAATV